MEKVKLNIVPKGKKSTCYTSQNDNGRVVRFELFNELIPYILDGSETISIKVVRPDSEEILESIENTFEGKDYIDVVFNANMTEIAGVGECEITITDGETVLGSRNFDMNIEVDAYNGRDVIIETASGTLAEFDTEIEDNALEYESSIPYNAAGYTGLRVINTRTAPVYDKTPYLFRKTPSGSGNSCIEKLNGLTVAYNQLISNGNFADISGWLTSNVTLTANNNIGTAVQASNSSLLYRTGLNSVIGHKYLISLSVKLNIASSGFVVYGFGTYAEAPIFRASESTEWQGFSKIISLQNIDADKLYIGDKTQAQTYNIKNVMIIDLTQMFGSTIADYIYSLETAQAGAGVSFFKSLGFDAPYYPYNAGDLMNSIPVAKRVIGKNLLNVDKMFNYSGAYIINPDKSVTVIDNDYRGEAAMPTMRLLAGNYTISGLNGAGSTQISYFDDAGQLVAIVNSPITSANFTLDKTRDIYIKTGLYGSFPFTINPQIEYGSTVTAFELYKETIYNLGGDTLRGILKLDSNNNIYAYGDIKTNGGKIKRKFYIVDLGSLNYEKATSGGVTIFYAGLPSTSIYLTPDLLCASKYQGVSKYWTNLGDKEISVGVDEPYLIGIRDTDYDNSDTTTFKSSLNGNYLMLPLATPTTEESTPFDNPQEAGTTEEIIDGNFYDIVDLGSLNWSTVASAVSGVSEFYSGDIINYIKKPDNNNIVANIICKKYISLSANQTYFGGIGIAIRADGAIMCDNTTNYPDVATFEASLDGVYLYYEKSDSAGVEIPLGHNSIYGTDIEYQDIDFNTTVYGGEIDAVNGVLSSEYNSDGSVKPTPEIINITPALIPVKAGDNKIFNTANGNQTIRYYNQVEE